MRSAILLSVVAVVNAFSFGGFNLPSIPAFSIPTLSVFPSIPADIASLIPESIPSFAFNFSSKISEIPSFEIPELPSIDPDSYQSVVPDYRSLVPTAMPEVNDILKSLGVSPLPFPSKMPELPTLDDFGLRDNDIIDFWRQNKTLKVPESEQELRDFLGNRTKFDFDRADAVIDKLGQDTGYDVRGSIRMISSLVLNNQSFDQVYKRTTTEFTVYTQRIKEGLQNTFNFSISQLKLPSSIDSANLTLSVIKYARNPYAAISDQRLNSSVVSIMVGDMMGNETRIEGLAELINFTLPLDGEPEDGACVFWNETGAAWSTDGCQLLGLVADVATCGCNHLTDFAFVALPIPSAAPSPATITPSQILESTATPTLAPTAAPTQTTHILIAAATPTPNGTSPAVIGLASAGSLLGVVIAAAIYLNIRHARRRRIENMKAIPRPLHNNPISQIVVRT
jgi:hypothetical protein